MPSFDAGLARASLVAVWLGTALVSAIEFGGQSQQLLAASGISEGHLSTLLIGGGIAVDVVLGLALWLRPRRASYLTALAMLLAMTLIATVLQPALWLHPLGPLLKNLPIAVMLWSLARNAP